MTTTPDIAAPPPPARSRAWLAVSLVLLVAAAVRAADFPHRDELRDMDETGYLDGGLVLFEGETPGIRVSPAAPESWAVWLYAAGRSAALAAHPTPAVRTASWQARPYLIVDRVLFDLYSDMGGLHRFVLVLTAIVGVAGAYGAFRLGQAYGGTAGGALAGGLAAVLPAYVDFAGMTRPYSDAWAFSLLALGSVATVRGGWRRWVQTGVWLALAVGSRVDMLTVVPIVLWVFWDRRGLTTGGRWWASAGKAVGLAAVLVLLMAPWLTMAPFGILRTIATTRGTPLAVPAGNARVATAIELFWGQGLGPAVLCGVALLLAVPGAAWGRRWVLGIVLLGLAATMFVGPYVPLRYHGGPVVALLVIAAVGAGAGLTRWSGGTRWAWGAVGVAVLLPAVQAARLVVAHRRAYVANGATAWVEAHVPPGTRVYDQVVWDLRPPLPTPAAADAAWDEVSDEHAWRRKFERGLSRFGVSAADVPRAMSEDNLVLDRGLWRRYFILGTGRAWTGRPRYDLRPYGVGSQVFGEQDVAGAFNRDGGVVIWREPAPPPAGLGTPVVSWVGPDGNGTRVYCSASVALRP